MELASRAIRPAALAALAIAILLAGSRREAAADSKEPEQKTSAKGTKYIIRMPESYDAAKGAPLVVVFHAKKADAKEAIAALMRPSLKDAILVAPNSKDETGLWSIIEGPNGDLDAVTDLVRELQRQHRPTRTILFGFFYNSGEMALSFALAHPELAEATVTQYGTIPEERSIPDSPELKSHAFYLITSDWYSAKCAKSAKALKGRARRVFVEDMGAEGKPNAEGRYDDREAAWDRGFAWISRILGREARTLTDAEAADWIAKIEPALKGNDRDAAETAFAALCGARGKAVAKAAALAAANVEASDADLALAAIECAGHLGDDGVKALKKVGAAREATAKAAAAALAATGSPLACDPLAALLKAKSDEVAAAAAAALADLGADAGAAHLVAALEKAEASQAEARKAAISDALQKLTGHGPLASAKEWKAFLRERQAKPGE